MLKSFILNKNSFDFNEIKNFNYDILPNQYDLKMRCKSVDIEIFGGV